MRNDPRANRSARRGRRARHEKRLAKKALADPAALREACRLAPGGPSPEFYELVWEKLYFRGGAIDARRSTVRLVANAAYRRLVERLAGMCAGMTVAIPAGKKEG